MQYRHVALGACAALLFAGCEAPSFAPADLDPPQVVDASPTGSGVSTEPTIRIVFSELMDPDSILAAEEGAVFALVPSAEVDDLFRSDFNSPPLISSRQELLVPGVLSLDTEGERSVLTFEPTVQLMGNTSYTYLLSSAATDLPDETTEAANPLVVPLLDDQGNEVTYDEGPVAGETVFVTGTFERSFLTGEAVDRTPPQVIERVPADEATGVPPNLAAVSVTFDEPVVGLTGQSFYLEGPGGQVTGDVILTPDRTTADLQLTAALQTSTQYRVVLTSAIRDEAGNPVDELASDSTFTTAACLDNEAPTITGGTVESAAVDVRATITWRTNEPSTSVVRYGTGAPNIEVTGPVSTCAGAFDPCASPLPDADCLHTVTVTGLTPETDYVFVVESEDASGNAAVSVQQSFTTTEPLPALVLNELMIDAPSSPEATGEYLEIYNAGEQAVELAGWQVQEADETPGVLEAFQGGATLLGPGQYALAVGSDFDPTVYPDQAAEVIVQVPGGSLAGSGLANSRPVEIQLIAPEGAVVSTYGGWITGSREGVSIERQDPLGLDEAGNWSFAQVPPSSTPGAQNSVTP